MWKRLNMKMTKFQVAACLLVLLVLASVAAAEVTVKKARKIGKKNIEKMMDQSYHYRIEFDTIIVLPVHSKIVWKNDFYLLYFLKDGYFQVEMEVDKKTGDPTILTKGKMSRPYFDLPDGTFNYKYFNADSMMSYATKRQRLQQDSVRLVYFGVVPRLGKRGVLWEIFSTEGVVYYSMRGPSLTMEQVVRDLNLEQHKLGNYTVDSLRMIDIMKEIDRLETLTGAEKRELKLYPQTKDSLVAALMDERKQLIIKFPNLGRFFPLPDYGTGEKSETEPEEKP
jgi:hypothetical protein